MSDTLNDHMERFYRSFLAVMHFFHRMTIDISRTSTLSLSQFRVLMVLHHYGPMNVNELKKKLNIAQSTASELIERLVQQQMLAKERSPEDKRKTLLVLTPRAKKLIRTQHNRSKNYYRNMFSKLDKSDQRRLVESFEQIQRIVEKYGFMEHDTP